MATIKINPIVPAWIAQDCTCSSGLDIRTYRYLAAQELANKMQFGALQALCIQASKHADKNGGDYPAETLEMIQEIANIILNKYGIDADETTTTDLIEAIGEWEIADCFTD